MAATSNRRLADDADKPFRGRRLSWSEFAKLTGREPPTPDNDNDAAESGLDIRESGHAPWQALSQRGTTNDV